MAPTISAITALGGMPSVSSGMNEVCEPALLADSGPPHRGCCPCRRALRRAQLGLLLDGVGRKGRQQRTAAGQDAQHAEPSAVPRSTAGHHVAEVFLGGHQARDLAGEDLTLFFGLRQVLMISP
jgi:hypothetical protein